jgi:hypothetical protein
LAISAPIPELAPVTSVVCPFNEILEVKIVEAPISDGRRIAPKSLIDTSLDSTGE